MQLFATLLGLRETRRPSVAPGQASDPIEVDPGRKACLERIGSLLSDLTKDESRELVWEAARAFARRVYDVPASERHHHHDRWGLLDHSLEVAEFAVRAALGANFMESTAPHPEVQEFRVPRLRYAAFFLALHHDIGKILGVVVHSGRRTWNPLAEDLAEFASGSEPPTLLWRAGRGDDAHKHHMSYLLGMFSVPAIARYLTAPLLAETLEGRTAAAQRLNDLVIKADQKSTVLDLARQARAKETPAAPIGPSYAQLSVGYAELVPKAFGEGLREALFAVNTLDGDLWIGKEYVALRYPATVGKLAALVRERLGPVSQKARMLPAGDEGARALAHHLSEHELLFRDASTGSWKVQMSLSMNGSFHVTAAILVPRKTLFPGAEGHAPEIFPGQTSFARPSDSSELGIPGFRHMEKPATSAAAPGAADRPPAPPPRLVPRPIEPVRPTPDALPLEPPPAPVAVADPAALAALRAHVVPGILLEDIRRLILEGKIPVNQWNAQVYVLEDRTYFVTPNGFRRLVENGLYSLDPSKQGNTYLDALAKLDCVHKHGAGRVVTRIRLRENAKPCCVVVFETRGLFRNEQEIARVGYWTETRITEDGSPPPDALPPRKEGASDD